MYDEFDDEVFLAPETTVSLHFDRESTDGGDEWDIAAGESLEHTGRNGWVRHALRADSASDYYDRDEERGRDLHAALHDTLTLVGD